jgi:hypothetical protein
MDFNPTSESEVQGLHAALGALFVTFPSAVWGLHPSWNFCYGHPRLFGSFCGVVFAMVKEFVWDQDMENDITRGSNWFDFSLYMVGIIVANGLLWI